jgi:competence protein ComEA
MEFIKTHIYAIAGIACVVVLGVLYLTQWHRPAAVVLPGEAVVIYAAGEVEAPAETAAPVANRRVLVYVTGQVANPGVYEAGEGDRVNDLLAMAGGPTDEADLMRVNLAAHVQDAMQITVPALGDGTSDAEIITVPGGFEPGGPALININTAGLEQLRTLPGIGAAIAQGIVDYRNANGGFSSIEEIKNVSRIGEITFERIKDSITVN